MADYDIVVALEGDVSNFTQAMVTAKDSLSDFKKSTAGITDKVGSAFEGVGKNLTR